MLMKLVNFKLKKGHLNLVKSIVGGGEVRYTFILDVIHFSR